MTGTSAAGTILEFGDPLGFKMRAATARSPAVTGTGADIFKVEARTLSGHQKEAIVTEGENGSMWRLASDEGKGMKGDDLAPFPLGFFNAGVTGDVANRIRQCAQQRGVALDGLRIGMAQYYAATGSFIHSTASASTDGVELGIALEGDIAPNVAKALVQAALDVSPAVAMLRHEMLENSFALYINGRRCRVIDHREPVARDVTDPYLAHKSPPRPLKEALREDLIRKTVDAESSQIADVPMTVTDKRQFAIESEGVMQADDGECKMEVWIARPGMSRFAMISDESDADAAPSGLGLMSAGIGLCYLTQLSRYIDAQKLDISGARLVQFTPFSAGPQAMPGPIDTHLFLNGQAPDDIHLNLLTIAARTCFMHVAAMTAQEPKVSVSVNGHSVG